MSGLRRRLGTGLSTKDYAIEVIQKLDAFPKVNETYQKQSSTSGAVSILVFGMIAVLVISELKHYYQSDIKYSYEVDKDFTSKLNINIDMTVAMKCEHIGADVLDSTGENTVMMGQIELTPAYFSLSPEQLLIHDMVNKVHSTLREHYHSMHKLVWKDGYSKWLSDIPFVETKGDAHDACRIHGSVVVNKVMGNFHVTAGKSIPVFPSGHAHLSFGVVEADYNFSHRIDHISFGKVVPGMINQLDAEMKITNETRYNFQYFLNVVPTNVNTRFAKAEAYQFSVTENQKPINHVAGKHGMPGIYFKYELSPLKVHVVESAMPFVELCIRLIGIVGGIFATSGLFNHLIGLFVNIVYCRYFTGPAALPNYVPCPPDAGAAVPASILQEET